MYFECRIASFPIRCALLIFKLTVVHVTCMVFLMVLAVKLTDKNMLSYKGSHLSLLTQL